MGRRSKFTPRQKMEAVLAVLSERKTTTEVCEELGISRETLARWRQRGLEAMEAGLADKAARAGRDMMLERRVAEAERRLQRFVRNSAMRGSKDA